MCAYRIEKEPNGEEVLVFDGWDEGMAPGPYSGVNRLFNVDLSTPGEVAVGYPITANATSGGTLGTPIADSTRFFSYGTPGVPVGSAQSFAILDANGRVWESTSITGTYTYLSSNSTLTGASSSDGLAYWLGYLFKTRGANIDYWNGSTWTNAWQGTLSTVVKHFMYVGTDNVLYITNGNYLASVTAPTPTAFVPGTSSTYAFSTTKLQLPVTDMAISIAEVGMGTSSASTLLIGGFQNAIYPWDKVSSSFSLPIYVAESYIRLMVSVNQNVFIFPGNQQGRGRIYITNGSQANVFFKMPDYVFGQQDPYYVWGDAIFHRNFLIFGAFITPNSGAAPLSFAEIYALNLDTKAFLTLSNISVASGKACANCLISTSSLSSPGMGFIAAWDDNSSVPGIGYTGTTAGTGTATVITDLVPVGTIINKKTFTQVEYKLRSPLIGGETLSITPIADTVTGSALTFNPAITTGVISGVAPVNFQANQWLQFKASLTGNGATSGVRLREIRLR